MTPAETFAQSRREAENLIRQHAPARLQDAVIERLLPAVALVATRTDDREIAVGVSKFGGAPDVPEDFAWPMWNERPLSFVAQINLDEIAPFDIKNKLPSSGLLSFFYDMNEDSDWPWGELADEGGWRVFHLEGKLKRAEVSVETQISHGLKTATITAQIFCDIPNSIYWIDVDAIELLEEIDLKENRECEEFLESLQTQRRSLKMLGHSTIVQNDARCETVWMTKRGNPDEWLVLLQMDMDDELDWMWGDGGAMFYLMHRDDLANRAFDKCWLNAQCC